MTSDSAQLGFQLAWGAKQPAVEPLELSPARLDEVVRSADVPRVFDDLSAGMGFSRRVPNVTNGYGYALPGYTRAPGGMFCPAGKVTEITLPVALPGGITCSERFATPGVTLVYLGTEGPHVLVLSSGGDFADVAYTITIPGWATSSMVVFNDRLYLGSGVGLVYLDSAGIWHETSSVIRPYLAVVAWRPLGVPTEVLVGVSPDFGFNAIRWIPITGHPETDSEWSAPVRIGPRGATDLAYTTHKLIAAPQRVFMLRPDGVYDMDELGARAFNIAPWVAEGMDHFNGGWGLWMGDGLYYAHVQGVTFIPTTGETQYRPEWAQPGWGLPYEGPVRGFVNAGTLHNGWGMVGMWGTSGTAESYVLAGRRDPQSAYGAATHVWHGAEAVVPGSIQHMRVWPIGWSWGQPQLLITTRGGPGPAPGVHAYWQSLPRAGTPIQEMLWGGGFQPADAASLFLPADPYERPSAIKSMLQFEMVTEHIDLGSDLVKVYASSDTSPSWAFQGQAEDGSYTRLMPVEVTEGRYISTRVDLIGHPILRSLDARAALGIELREARTYRVILSSASANGTARRENRDPERRMLDLAAMLGQVVWLDDGTTGGEPIRVRVLQVLAGERQRLGTPSHGETWAIVVPIVVSMLDHPFRYDAAAHFDTDRTWR